MCVNAKSPQSCPTLYDPRDCSLPGSSIHGISQARMLEEYTEELYKKDLHDQDNHEDVVTNLEPVILKYEIKWALGSISMNKASGGDGIPAELL